MKSLERAFVLNRISYSETSLVIKSFTKNHGLKSFLIQGGKKKYAALIQVLSPIEFTFNQRHEDQLCKMYDLRLFLNLPEIRFNPIKSSIAFFQSEVLLQCIEEGMIDEALFYFLENELIWLNENNSLANYLLYWLLELSSVLGFKPYATTENACFFDMENGVLVEQLQHGSQGVSGNEINLLRQLLDLEKSELLELISNRDERNKLLEILLQYYSFHIPRFKKIKCLEVYESIWND